MAAFQLPASYVNFYTASTQVSAALIGLLFVSVSISTESVFGEKASLQRQLTAFSAFTALVNTFFISFTSILPNNPNGTTVVTLGALALGATVADGVVAIRSRRGRQRVRAVFAVLLIAGLYGYELALGVRLMSQPDDLNALTALNTVIVVAYAIGLSRAWQLLGGRRGLGLFLQIRDMVRRGQASGDGEDEA